MSGYSLMKKIGQTAGMKPSPGSMYPLLESLFKDKLVKVKEEGRKKVYSITKIGKEHLDSLSGKRDEIIDALIHDLNAFEAVFRCGANISVDFLQRMKQGEMPFKEIHPAIFKYKKEFIRLMKTGRVEANKAEISKVLNDATKKLSKLK